MPQTKHQRLILLMASLCFPSSRINSPIFNFSFCGTLHFVKKPSPVVSVSKCPCHLFLLSITSLPSNCYCCVTEDLSYILFSNWPPATNFSLAPIQIFLQSSLTFVIMTPMLKNLKRISLARKKI